MSRRSDAITSGDEIVGSRPMENGYRPVRASRSGDYANRGSEAWRALSDRSRGVQPIANTAFAARVFDAKAMLRGNRPPDEVREKHGSCVLRAAFEAMPALGGIA